MSKNKATSSDVEGAMLKKMEPSGQGGRGETLRSPGVGPSGALLLGSQWTGLDVPCRKSDRRPGLSFFSTADARREREGHAAQAHVQLQSSTMATKPERARSR